MLIKVNCNYCGKELFREPNQIRTNKNHYCDRKCLGGSKKNSEEVECNWCSAPLIRIRSTVHKNTTGKFFCGFDCRSQFDRQYYKVKCVVCGLEFEKNPAEQKRHPVYCCSVECRLKYYSKREVRKCDECSKEVCRPRSLFKGRGNIFCSTKCYDEFQNTKTEVECAKCEKKVWKSPSAMKERHYFCSRECFGKFAFAESFVETEFEKLVQNLEIPYSRNNWNILKGAGRTGRSLELDFYFPTIKFAVEVNGICHYFPVHGEDALSGQKVRDKIKRRVCKELGIILRVVKPGNCKRETYMPRYKRVVWEIKKEIENERSRKV